MKLPWIAVPASVFAVVLGTALLAPTAQAAPVSSSSFENREAAALQVFERVSSAEDSSAEYNALSADERSAFEAYFLPARAEETLLLTPLDSNARAASHAGEVGDHYSSIEAAATDVSSTLGCWGTWAKNTQWAAAGNALFDTYTEGTWCANGSKVTSATFTRSWSSIAALGWRDAGQTGRGSAVVGNRAKIWSQRKLILGVGGWDVQTQLPCTRLIGTAAGKASGDRSCSIY